MEKLVIIKTLSELDALREYLADKEFLSFDTETTGVDVDSEVIGFSVSADVESGYYVILKRWSMASGALEDLISNHDAAAFLPCLIGKKLIMHNAVFDCAMINRNFNVELMPSVHTDTMILAHLLDENRSSGLKELGVAIFGEDSRKEQDEMKASVAANGGVLTKAKYELYKADADLIARYGAKDTILTLKLFYHLVPDLYEQGLDDFFYKDESMPLLRGPTYQLNTTGLRVDTEKLQALKGTLEAECLELKSYIYSEITPHVKDKYPGTGKTNVFNIGASKQLAWLLFERLGNDFGTLTEEGRALCKALGMRLPYSFAGKREFIQTVNDNKGRIWAEAAYNPKTKKMSRPKKIGDSWTYMSCGKETLGKLKTKYKWADSLLQYAKNLKLLNTYVEGIQARAKYNIIHPSFLQHGTTSGRYSSRNPNFQNLPRDDKRIKSCLIARPGNVFVGADYSQLEPRVFASFSGDPRLLQCFADGDDFYSVIGSEVFDKLGFSLKKDDDNAFAKKFPDLRNIAKTIALSATYGTTAPKMAVALGKRIDEAQEILNNYFERFPKVHTLMEESHAQAKADGRVVNLFGRPRRMPLAKDIQKIYGNTSHGDLPFEARNLLNLSVNHRIQSTGASIMNRAAIAIATTCEDLAQTDPAWAKVKIVLQVHDQLILEGPEELGEDMRAIVKAGMEATVILPGVALIADPSISKDLAGQK